MPALLITSFPLFKILKELFSSFNISLPFSVDNEYEKRKKEIIL